MQERLLTEKLLTFSEEIIWECESGILLEGGQEPLLEEQPGTSYVSRSDLSPAWKIRENKETLYASWHTLVVQYSSKSLTRSSDVLPALSALASRYHAKLDDKYLAGIWEGNALEDMLWFINSDEHTCSEGFEYRAPS